MTARRGFDKDRFAYELAQELGIDYARVPTQRAPDEALRQVQDEIQGTMEYGPPRRGIEAARAPEDIEELSVTNGAASGLSAVNRARATPTRSTLEKSPVRAAQEDAEDVLDSLHDAADEDGSPGSF